MEGRLKEYPECCITIVAKDNCWLNQVKLAYLVGAKLCSCCSKKKLRDKKKAYSRFLRQTGKETKAYSRLLIIQVPESSYRVEAI